LKDKDYLLKSTRWIFDERNFFQMGEKLNKQNIAYELFTQQKNFNEGFLKVCEQILRLMRRGIGKTKNLLTEGNLVTDIRDKQFQSAVVIE
jgi:hypothetical protein